MVVTMRNQDDRLRLLNTYEVMERTGLSYERALAFLKVHGIKQGRCYYITVCALREALAGPARQSGRN